MFSLPGTRVWSRTAASLFLTGLLLGGLCPPVGAASPALPNPIIFVQQQPLDYAFATIGDIFGNFEGYHPPSDQPVGGNLFRLDPDGHVVNLTGRSDVAVRDPEISFDGTRVVFSMKEGGFGRWQVYELGVDGTGLRKISLDPGFHDLDPSYMPDGRIVFTTDRNGWADNYENLPSAQIAVMNTDGSGVEVLKQSPGGQFNPLVGSQGKIYLTQWDLHDRRANVLQNESEFDINRFLLWELYPDGSGQDHPAFGAHTLYDADGGYVEVREIPAAPGTFLATLADEFFTFGGGSIVRLEPHANQDQDEPIFVTKNVFRSLKQNREGRWRSPYPLSDGRILASYASGPVHIQRNGTITGGVVPHWRLVTMGSDGSGQRTIFEDPRLWSWQPVEVVSRPTPPVLKGEMKPQYNYALINSLDVTLRGINEDQVVNGDFQPTLSRGQIKAIRLLRENVRSQGFYSAFPRHSDPDTEVLGTAPVYEDGSFAVLVPPDTPVTWELLDEDGEVVVRERYGAELKAGEVRQCDGCHTPHNQRQGNQTNLALGSPTNLSGEEVDKNHNGVVDLLEHGSCEPGPTNLCLNGNRFRVEVTWQGLQEKGGAGKPKGLTDDTGYFWFFTETNVELVIKVLDGRAINGYFWVFSGALSNLQYEITVTDTVTGDSRSYFNPAGNLSSKADLEAFGPFAKAGASASPEALKALAQASSASGLSLPAASFP